MMLTLENLETLRRPFNANDHEWRENKFVYITEEAITTRLEEVDPSWTLDIVNCQIRDNQAVAVVRLTVCGVARDGVGMQIVNDKAGEAEKGAATDALKRAARLFGVGRYLLGAPDRNSFNKWLQSLTAPNAKPAAGQPQAQSAGSEPGKSSGVSDEQNWDKAKPLLAAIFPKGGISHAQHVFKLLQDAGIVDKKDGVTSAIKKMTMYRDCRENGSLPEKPTADQITAAFAALAESQMADGADIAF